MSESPTPANADFLTSRGDPAAPAERRPQLLTSERVMVAIAALSLAAACWLVSSPGGASEDGARPWRSGSVLQAITAVMALNFEYPTRRGNEVKWLVQGLAAAVALAAGLIGWFLRSRREQPAALPETPGSAPPTVRTRLESLFTSLTPTNSAQMAFLLFAGWTFLSAWWAPWPRGALGEAFRQLVPIVWAIVLGRTLGTRGVRVASALVAAVLFLTSVIGLWYYYERNPVQRLKFPIGNPIFMGAVLLPGLVMPLCWMGSLAWDGLRLRWHAPNAAARGPGLPALLPLWVWSIAAAMCLPIVGWAFRLTGSRGPLLGLGMGLAAAVYVVMSRKLRWVVLAVTGVAFVLFASYQVKHMDDDAARASTIRFRLYAWRIAVERFVVRPVSGGGQGSYLLGAQSKALDYFVSDPAAFPNPMLDHAHNEWLEILADLGAAGFALVSTALGVTFWAAGLAMTRLRSPADRACLLGLIGSLAALIAEEATSVGLHKPVIPLVFFTLVGLIWAMARSTERHPPNALSHPPGRLLRGLGLSGGLVSAAVIAWLVLADWHGARADFRVTQLSEKLDWPAAMEQAAVAQRMRWGIEDRIWALEHATDVAGRAADYWAGELAAILARARSAGELTPTARNVALETAAKYEPYFRDCVESGQALLMRFPHYPNVAAWMADALLRHDQAQAVAVQLGLLPEVESHLDDARRWMAYEYRCNPLNPDTAMRLLRLLPAEEALAGRLDLVRVSLRSGPVHPMAAPFLVQMMREPDFNSIMNGWMNAAQTAVDNPAAGWADPYVPESLRLAALCEEIGRDQVLNGVTVGRAERESREAAARIARLAVPRAQHAADLLLPVRSRYPSAASFARADQARYQLIAEPATPEAALKIYRQAISEWMPGGSRDQQRTLQAGLSIFLLAAGQDQEARANLEQLSPGAGSRIVDARLAVSLQQLCQWFINSWPALRPAAFDSWVHRHAELAPELPMAQWMAAQVDLEHGRHADAFARLDRIAELDSGQRLDTALRLLMKRFPDDTALRAFIRQRASATQPGEEPATAPAPPEAPTTAAAPA